MAISKKDRDEMKKNKPMVDFDFGTPLPPKTDDFSFKDMSPQTSLDEIDTVEKKTLPKKRKGAVKKATKTSSHDSKKTDQPPPHTEKKVNIKLKYMLYELLSTLGIKESSPYINTSVMLIASHLNISKRTAQKYLRQWEYEGMISCTDESDPATKKPARYVVSTEMFF